MRIRIPKEIAKELVTHEGCFRDDPQAWAIFEVTDPFGYTDYVAYYHPLHFDLEDDPQVASYRPLWTRELGALVANF